MGEINFINDKGEADTCYINDKLLKGLNKVKDKVNTKDFDQVFLIDGPEGSGKSVLGMQLAKAVDPSFCLERVCMNPTQFVKAIQTAEKGQAVIYDEAYTGLASRHSLSEVNKLIVSMMMEMRAKNLIVFIILPTFFMLDKYVAIFRSKGLFHTYLNKSRRGYWVFYNVKKKKLLYLVGKKTMTYGKPRVNFRGTFGGKYVLNEDEYRNKKRMALNDRDHRGSNAMKAEERYNNIAYCLVYYLNKEQKIGEVKLANLITGLGVHISKTNIRYLLDKYSDFKRNLAESSPVRQTI